MGILWDLTFFGTITLCILAVVIFRCWKTIRYLPLGGTVGPTYWGRYENSTEHEGMALRVVTLPKLTFKEWVAAATSMFTQVQAKRGASIDAPKNIRFAYRRPMAS